jgi:YidC/Oxa1 family membrane protein insertase
VFDPILDPAYRLLATLSDITGPVAAIVLFTVAVRLLLLPLSVRQARALRKRAALAPKVQKLRDRHARDPQRLYRETNALYAAEGTSAFAGLLPGLAQSPFFMVMYRIFASATIAGHANLLLAQGALGVPLGEHFAAVLGASGLFSPAAAVFIGLFALLAAVAWAMSRRMPAESPRLLRLMPFGVVAAGVVLPLAAGLYLLVSTAWTATERLFLYPRSPALA